MATPSLETRLAAIEAVLSNFAYEQAVLVQILIDVTGASLQQVTERLQAAAEAAPNTPAAALFLQMRQFLLAQRQQADRSN